MDQSELTIAHVRSKIAEMLMIFRQEALRHEHTLGTCTPTNSTAFFRRKLAAEITAYRHRIAGVRETVRAIFQEE